MIDPYLDILIVGAGQAGLALGHALQALNYRFELVENHNRVGDVWRGRYDSLLLFTPRSSSALPGLPVPGEPDGYASKDEFADYLENYANHFHLPVKLNSGICELSRENRHFRAVTISGEAIEARIVVLATGGFQTPSVPAFANQFDSDVIQLTPHTYKAPSQIPDGKTVLVVGDGASGRDFASELATKHKVFLAIGKNRKLFPEKIFGRPFFYWLDKIGALQAPPSTPIGWYLKKTDSFPNRGQGLDQMKSKGIDILPKIINAEGRKAVFADGVVAEVDAVVWAIGYHDNSQWITIPEIKDDRGNFIHNKGVAPVPGLFFIGRPWQRSRGSAFIGGVGFDADFIAKHIVRFLQ